MRICDSEENRRKLAWLVPGYILLAWFFCVVFQPLGLSSVPGHGNNNDLNDESLYEIINLQDDPQVAAYFNYAILMCLEPILNKQTQRILQCFFNVTF